MTDIYCSECGLFGECECPPPAHTPTCRFGGTVTHWTPRAPDLECPRCAERLAGMGWAQRRAREE